MRRPWLVLGTALFLSGLVVPFAPTLGIDWSLVSYGVGAGLVLTGVVAHVLAPDPAAPATLASGRRYPASETGLAAAFDDRLEAAVADTRAYEEHAPELREQLRDAAVRILCHAEDWSEETAHDRLDAGEWTENSTARALFADRTRLSLGQRLNEWLFPRRAFRNRVEAATAELETYPRQDR